MMTRVWITTECKLWLRDPALWAFSAFYVIALVYAVQMGQARQAALLEITQQALAEQAEMQTKNFAELEAFEAGERNYTELFGTPRSYFTWANSVTVFPVSQWSFLATGSSDVFAPVNSVNFYQKPKLSGQDLANPTTRLFGNFDPAFVLIYVLPLLVIALNYRMIAFERDQGILPLWLGQSRHALGLLLQRAALRFLLTLLFVGVSLVLACLAAQVPLLSEPSKLLMLSGLLLFYTLFWFLLVLVINGLGWQASRCALALFGCWSLFLLIIPSLAHLLGSVMFHVPSRVNLVNEQRSASAEAAKQAQDLLDQYLLDHPELMDLKSDEHADYQRTFQWYQRTFATYDATQRAIAAKEAAFREDLSARTAWERRFAWLSPSVVFAQGLEALAGTSMAHYWAYDEALAQYAAQWRDFFRTKAFSEMAIVSADRERLPQFEPEVADMQSDSLAMIGVLALFCALLFVPILRIDFGVLQ